MYLWLQDILCHAIGNPSCDTNDPSVLKYAGHSMLPPPLSVSRNLLWKMFDLMVCVVCFDQDLSCRTSDLILNAMDAASGVSSDRYPWKWEASLHMHVGKLRMEIYAMCVSRRKLAARRCATYTLGLDLKSLRTCTWSFPDLSMHHALHVPSQCRVRGKRFAGKRTARSYQQL